MTKKKTAAEKLRKNTPKIKLTNKKAAQGGSPQQPPDPPRRNDWDANHAIIRDKFIELIRLNKRRPTIAEVSIASGLSKTCIKEHISKLKFEPLKHDLRILTDDVMLTIYESARGGNSGSQRLWAELMEGWKPGLQLEGPKGGPIRFKEMSTVSDAALLAALRNPEKVKKDA